MVTWTGAPVRIFAGARDDYDDRDPEACNEFVASLPEEARKHFSIHVYPGATHGWDQKDADFPEKIACKGNGCNVHNRANPGVTKQSIADLVSFFSETLR